MDLEKILGTDTGKEAFYKSDRNFDKIKTELEGISGGKRTARFVVGTSTSGWTEKDCDYLCDGTADQTEINAAITALPATGGEIVILDGTYNITAKIDVIKDNVSIRGNGNATILKRMWSSTNWTSGVIHLGRDYCVVENLRIDGNIGLYNDNRNLGISVEGSNNTIINCTCINNNSGIYANGAVNTLISNNQCLGNDYGIRIYASKNANVTDNIVCDNNTAIYLYGGAIDGHCERNIIANNICFRGEGSTSDYAAAQYTIRLDGTYNRNNLISSNLCLGKAVAIQGSGNSAWGNKFDNTDDLP